MDIDVRTFLEDYFTDTWGTVEIFDLSSGSTLYEGDADSIPDELESEIVMSIDWPSGSKLTFNISIEE